MYFCYFQLPLDSVESLLQRIIRRDGSQLAKGVSHGADIVSSDIPHHVSITDVLYTQGHSSDPLVARCFKLSKFELFFLTSVSLL